MRKATHQSRSLSFDSYRDNEAAYSLALYDIDHGDERYVSVVARTGHASGCRGAHCATCLACLVLIQYRLFVGSSRDRVFCRVCLHQVSIHR